jgi:hypothetical protein
MCFSATASFVTAGVTGAIGVAALARAHEPREWPLAATPLFFALQQTVEGFLWLALPAAPEGAVATYLTFAFLFFAQVFWPVYAPATTLLIEPHERRRQLMLVCLALGAGVGAYLFWSIVTREHDAVVLDGHIVYATEYAHSEAIGVAYLTATGLPLLLSSRRTVFALGAIIIAGSVAAYIFYWESFVSVWCFFAAAASVVILLYFEQSRRTRMRVAGA